MNEKPLKILLGSSVRQKPAILKEFLASLTGLDRSGLTADCLFIDNNDLAESAKMLAEFRLDGATVYLGSDRPAEDYHCSEETHYWNEGLIWRVAAYKDFILKFARDNNYTHVFMIDSDLVLHPLTLKQLLSAGADIVSEIFWTEWRPGLGELPQVWLAGQYSFHYGANVPEAEKNRQAAETLAQLKAPGIYEVGGLGACTLISANAIAGGVNYGRIGNVDYWGEDRHFCIRAAVLGFKLFVDTHYPAFHIYRESDLARLPEYRGRIASDAAAAPGSTEGHPPYSPDASSRQRRSGTWRRKDSGNRLTLSMVVRNEAGRYLQRVLAHARQYIDAAVIIDDASKDNTAEICQEVLKGLPLTLIRRKRSGFATEYKLRQQQWRETVKTDPDWILALDADEIFEDKIIPEISMMLNQTNFDVFSFRLYDFWDQDRYREDRWWQAHFFYRPLLVRYVPGFPYHWKETPQHCGRLPCNITELSCTFSPLRIKHFGWASPKDRECKYKRYLKLDPHGEFGIPEQYKSIMDSNPNLIRWEE